MLQALNEIYWLKFYTDFVFILFSSTLEQRQLQGEIN